MRWKKDSNVYRTDKETKEMSRTPLVILTGPTAAGKTELSIRLAEAIGAEIISADSMQVYKKMDIGTAKIMPDQMKGIRHYLVDELLPDEPFNVVIFQEKARSAIKEILSRGHIPMIVGGTGFYIQAVLRDIDFSDHTDDHSYRQSLERIAASEGGEVLYTMLKQQDPKAAQEIHPNNIKRVIRALEYHRQTGALISEHNSTQRAKKSPYNAAYFVLNMPRDILYARIERRVDEMMAVGLPEEVRKLREDGYDRSLVSMQGLGYKELLAYYDGELSLEEAVFLIKRDTRRFAKRQLTWFRREEDVIWLDKTAYPSDDALLMHMLEVLKNKDIIQTGE